jgi:hypothetical protein
VNKILKKPFFWVMAVPLAIAVLACLLVYPIGREEVPDVEAPVLPAYDLDKPMVDNRMADPAYLGTLKQIAAERREIATESLRIRQELSDLVTKAADEIRREQNPSTVPEEIDSIENETAIDMEKIEARARSYPEWEGLEKELQQSQNTLAEIKMRVSAMIRERMIAQYEQRKLAMAAAGVVPDPMPQPPEIARMTEEMRMTGEALMNSERTVITNISENVQLAIPPVPDRKPARMGASQP